MKVAIVLIAALASVQAGVRMVRQSGWPAPTTPGWSTTAPPTQGWSTAPPTQGWPSSTTQGWGSPGWSSTPGWGPSGSLTNIDLAAAVAAAGQGWAAENHAENVQAIGAGGWGPNAEINISAGGESIVDQSGGILQVTSQDQQQASSLNNAAVSHIAEASESESVDALGIDVSNAQSGWAGATGSGASAADAASILAVNPITLGLAKP